jgi:hypothetical protein
MGDVWIPDRSLTIDEVLHSLVMLEDDSATFVNDTVGLLQRALTTRRYSALIWEA